MKYEIAIINAYVSEDYTDMVTANFEVDGVVYSDVLVWHMEGTTYTKPTIPKGYCKELDIALRLYFADKRRF